jgi:hypothetical protein
VSIAELRGWQCSDIDCVCYSRRKEAADEKIKEMLRVFAVAPQTKIIYFGGGHDSGYGGSVHIPPHGIKAEAAYQCPGTLSKPGIGR